jgi:hypothetical protein
LAIVVVQSQKAFGVGVTIITTPAMSTTSGNFAVVDVSYYQPSNAFVSITDSVGLSWSQSIAEIVSTDGGNLSRQRYAQIVTGNASHTFSYNASAGDFPTMAVKEISGVATSSPLAETNTATDSGLSSHTISLTTSAQASCILCAFGACNPGAAMVLTQTGSFIQDQQDGLSSDHEGLLSSHLIISATGTNTFTFTTGDLDAMGMAIAAFKAALAADTLFAQAVM